MKKIICLLLVLFTMFVLGGCGNTNIPPENPSSEKVSEHIHKFGEWTIVKEPTCTEKGLQKRYCECGEIQEEELEVLPHNLTKVEKVEATCTEPGHTEGQECTVCGYSTVKEIKKLDHQLDEGVEVSAPTCEEKGKVKYICAVCGEEIIKETPALGHKYDEGTITKKASIDSSGEMTYKCTVCGETKTKAIPKIDLDDYTYDSGVYYVGDDIPAGMYILYSDVDQGYFALSSDANGNNILENDGFGKYTYVKLTEGTYLELNKCVAIAYFDEFVIDPYKNQYGDNMYLVGKDIDAGKYKITAAGHGYYCIYESPYGKIKTNGNIDAGESCYIDIKNGQYVKLSGVLIEKK